MADLTTTVPDVEGHSEIPTAPAGDLPAAPPDFMSVVPESFRESQWVKDTAKSEKPYETLFKRFEDQQKMLGEKSKALEIPGPDAPPEKIKEFHKAMGVPDKPEGYEYTLPDISKEPEAVRKILEERAKDPIFINKMREKALSVGITPQQFKDMAAEFDGITIAQIKANVENQKALIAADAAKRDETFKQLWGDAAPAKIKNADDILANPNVIPDIVRKSNDSRVLMVAALDYIYEKNFKNDKVNPGSMGAPPMTPQSIRARILELTSKPEYSNFQLAGHKELKRAVEALYLEEDRMKRNKTE
jgi:hypothetical protein